MGIGGWVVGYGDWWGLKSRSLVGWVNEWLGG